MNSNKSTNNNFVLTRLEVSAAIGIEVKHHLTLENISVNKLLEYLSYIHCTIFAFVPYGHKKWLGILELSSGNNIVEPFESIVKLVKSNKKLLVRQQSKLLADCLYRLVNSRLFMYGNNLTAHRFIIELSKCFDIFAEIDLRKIKHKKEFLCLFPNQNKEKIEQVLSDLTQGEEYKLPSEDISNPTKIHTWNDSSIKIGKYRYLSFQDKESNETYLISYSGHMIPIEEVSLLLKNIDNFSELNDLEISIKKHWKKKLTPLEAKKLGHNVKIFNFSKDTKITKPICMDIDLLTGLPIDEISDFRKQLLDLHITVMELPDKVDTISNASNSIKLAAKNIKMVKDQIIEAVGENFKNCDVVPCIDNSPVLSISMGGSGSGKSICPVLAGNENAVVASLDDARYFFFTYLLLVAVNHHADDYKIVELAANMVRDITYNKSIEKHINMHMDGSGVPWLARYNELFQLVKPFYKTIVTAVEAPFIRDEKIDNIEEYPTAKLPAYYRVIKRADKGSLKSRAMPLDLALLKHKQFGISILEAIHSVDCDEVVLVNSSKFRPPVLLARTVEVSTKVKDVLSLHGLNQEIAKKYKLMSIHQDHLGKNKINYAKVDYRLVKKTHSGYIILVIYNVDDFIDMITKSYLNKGAKYIEDILADGDCMSHWWKDIVRSEKSYIENKEMII